MRRGRTEAALNKGGACDWSSIKRADDAVPAGCSIATTAHEERVNENATGVGCPTSACALGMVLQQSVCC